MAGWPSAADLRDALQRAWDRSDQIFGILADGALVERPIGLRHPFVFYVGHLPAFAWNQLGGLVGAPSFAPAFDDLFERGIDPLTDEGAQEASIRDWPPIDAIRAYRDEVRRWVRDESFAAVAALGDDALAAHHRIHHLVLEHELMHHETLLYMLQELPHALKVRGELPGPVCGAAPGATARIPIPAGTAHLGADFARQFGWDNEFPATTVRVQPFALDSLPVTVGDYAAFVDAGGARPHGWVDHAGALCVRSMFEDAPIEDVAGWPVQVSHAQASAYARWKGGRLPTEAELQWAAFGAGGSEPTGVVDFAAWSPEPVGSHPHRTSPFGIHELIGNGWEWTASPFRPLPGFEAYARTYPGYSADFFDDAHFVVFGGSWATDARLLRPSLRNWYQGNYPYVFSSFRLAW